MSDAALLSDADVGLGAPNVSAASQGLMSDADVGLGGGSAAAPAAASAEPSTGADVAKGFGQGLIGGAESLVGLPGDALAGANWLKKKIDAAPTYGMSWLEGVAKQKLGLLGAGETPHTYALKQLGQMNDANDRAASTMTLPTTADVQKAGQAVGVPNYQPQTTLGQYAKTFGEFVPSAVAMPGEAAANIAKYALVPGALSETAGQLTQGTAAEPYARGVAALAGGVGSDLAVAGGSAAKAAVKHYWEPATAEGPAAIAVRNFRQAATDPEMAQAALQEGADAAQPGQAIGEDVPGSKPTTGQYLGDAGLVGLERDIATQRPDLFRSNDAGTGIDQQNAARTKALAGLQPTGAPEEVGNLVRQQLADLNATQDAKMVEATGAAESASNSALSSTEGAADTIAQAHGAATDTARATAQDLASGIGTGAPAAEQGAAARGVLQAARDTAKTNERGLWSAVDPNGDLALVATPISAAASSIRKSVSDFGQPIEGMEAQVLNRAADLPDVAPFEDVVALRKFVNTAMRKELTSNGQSPAYNRLQQLRGHVEDAIQNAVENQAVHETKAVQAGALAPDQTMEARVQKWVDDFKAQKVAEAGAEPPPPVPEPLKLNLDEAAADRLTEASAATKQRVATYDKGPVGVVNRKEGNSDTFRLPDSAVPGTLFRRGPRGAQTVQSVLDAAGPRGMNQVAKIAAESLRREAVGPDGVVDPKKFASWSKKYGEALSALPPELHQRFSSAAAATETLQALEKQSKQIIAPLQSAVESLGREVMQDGALDSKKFARWSAKHADEIAQLPQDVRDKLSTAAKASEAVAEAATARKQAIDGYQKSVAGKFLGLEHPDDVTRAVGGMLDSKNSVAQITALSKRLVGNDDAVQGLRKAIADVIVKRATGTTEAGTSGVKNLNASTFQKLIRDKRSSIKAAGFSDQEVNLMQAVADDMERSQRTMGGTKLPNSPGTAQDVAKFMTNAKKAREAGGHNPSIFTNILGGALGGWEVGGPKGALLGAGAGAGKAFAQRFIQARRNAGLAKASDLLTEMIHNPEVALAMLKKVPVETGRGSEYALQRLLARNSMFAATTLGRTNGLAEN